MVSYNGKDKIEAGQGRLERAIVLQPDLGSSAIGNRNPDTMLIETIGLAESIGLKVVTSKVVNVKKPHPATLFGPGNISDFKSQVISNKASLIIIGAPITPVQQRNLEHKWNTKVIDRTGLIIEIFGDRARTKEGSLQVELAALTYQRSRLVRSWTHLERQRGGAGFLGGPGERQLELDRRLIDQRLAKIKKQLSRVSRTRGLHRSARKRVPYPIVSLVGYTNAGKSTLFNNLTNSKVLAEDMLFATLDPTMRALSLPSGQNIILSDTVGFIQDLPTHLIAAFRSTLEEVVSSDIVLHVRDISHDETEQQQKDVSLILANLFNDSSLDTDNIPPIIEIFNKTDLLKKERYDYFQNIASRKENVIAVSALTGEGCLELLKKISEHILSEHVVLDIKIPLNDGAMLAWLYQNGDIIERRDGDQHFHISVCLSPTNHIRYINRMSENGKI